MESPRRCECLEPRYWWLSRRCSCLQGSAGCPYGCRFFIFSIWDTFPRYLLHFEANMLKFGTEIYNLHCSSICPRFPSIFPWCSLIVPLFYSMFHGFTRFVHGFHWFFHGVHRLFHSVHVFSMVSIDLSTVSINFYMHKMHLVTT